MNNNINKILILELSEIELSTMLEQLSGLSDLNSEFTERNFEEILKEAEELIDKSSFCDSNNEKPVNGATSLLINPAKVYEENSDLKINDNKDELNGNKSNIISSESNPPEEISNSKDTSFLTIKDSNNSETQVQQYSQPMFSPTNSTNHIKSTIDSIKQFSSLMEKQFSQAKILSASSTINSQYASNKIAVKKEEAQKSRKNFDSCLCDKSKSPLQYPEKVKTKTFSPKENSLEAGGNHQPIKPLSCFERLYQRRPARFSGSNENLKVAEKKPKVNIKKKNLEHIKLTGNALPTKSSKNSKIKMKCESNEHKSQKHEKDFSVLKNFSSNNVDLENYFKEVEFKSLKAQNFNFELPKEKCDYISNLSEEDLGLSNTLNYSKNEGEY